MLVSIAQTLHANRIIPCIGISSPLGDPHLSHEEEKALRKNIALAPLKALIATPCENQNSHQGDALDIFCTVYNNESCSVLNPTAGYQFCQRSEKIGQDFDKYGRIQELPE
jgi:betaine reductase